MLHLGLAGNTLCAIGGTPRLYRNIPEFPADLFQTALKLTLNPAKKETIGLFMEVEAPEPQHELFDLPTEVLPTYKSIGEFYVGLEILLLQADGILNFLGASLFLTTTVPKQLGPSAIGGLFPIVDPRSALRALKIIVEQGEGCSFESDQSHYAFFKKIYENYDLDYYDVEENIDSKNHATATFYPVMVASDAAYSFLFLTLEKLWQTTDESTRQELVSKNLRGSMRSVIGRLAKFLVQQEILDPISGQPTGKYAGPPFRRHKFKGNALNDLKSCMDKAASAYPNDPELKAAKEVVDGFIDLEVA